MPLINPTTYFSYKTPFGHVTVSEKNGNVVQVFLKNVSLSAEFAPSYATNTCATQLLEYFSGKRTVFDVPFAMEGTEFQRSVWKEVLNIPYGQTRTSKDIAELMGNPEGFRLVGKAVRENPLAIIIPSHRVVLSSGYVNKKDSTARLMDAFRKLERKNS